MKIITELSFERFQAWSGGKDTQDKIIAAGKAEEFEECIEELNPEGMTDTELNDLLWFDSELVFEWLGMSEDEESEDEEQEETPEE